MNVGDVFEYQTCEDDTEDGTEDQPRGTLAVPPFPVVSEREDVRREKQQEHESDDVSRTAEMREHRDDNHADATAEPGFADTSEPCAEAEDNDFCDGAASFTNWIAEV